MQTRKCETDPTVAALNVLLADLVIPAKCGLALDDPLDFLQRGLVQRVHVLASAQNLAGYASLPEPHPLIRSHQRKAARLGRSSTTVGAPNVCPATEYRDQLLRQPYDHLRHSSGAIRKLFTVSIGLPSGPLCSCEVLSPYFFGFHLASSFSRVSICSLRWPSMSPTLRSNSSPSALYFSSSPSRGESAISRHCAAKTSSPLSLARAMAAETSGSVSIQSFTVR